MKKGFVGYFNKSKLITHVIERRMDKTLLMCYKEAYSEHPKGDICLSDHSH